MGGEYNAVVALSMVSLDTLSEERSLYVLLSNGGH